MPVGKNAHQPTNRFLYRIVFRCWKIRDRRLSRYCQPAQYEPGGFASAGTTISRDLLFHLSSDASIDIRSGLTSFDVELADRSDKATEDLRHYAYAVSREIVLVVVRKTRFFRYPL